MFFQVFALRIPCVYSKYLLKYLSDIFFNWLWIKLMCLPSEYCLHKPVNRKPNNRRACIGWFELYLRITQKTQSPKVGRMHTFSTPSIFLEEHVHELTLLAISDRITTWYYTNADKYFIYVNIFWRLNEFNWLIS